MKKMVMAMVAVASAIVTFAAMPRSEWHAKVGDCALDPAELKAVMSQLSSEDKTAFLAEVNAAIAKMPGSEEVKASAFLNANRAAVASAGKDDRMAVLAEVYATVPVEYLTVINEEFAKSEFARPPAMNDHDFTNIVVGAMAKISERAASTEASASRVAFAGLMFLRASGESASSGTMVSDTVISSLPQDVQSDARSSWYPSAMAASRSYEPMLSSSGTGGAQPDYSVVSAISGASLVDSMLSDLQSGTTSGGATSSSVSGSGSNIGTAGSSSMGSTGGGVTRVPRDRLMNPAVPLSSVTGDPADSGSYVENPYYYKGDHSGVDGGGDSGEGGGGSEPSPGPEPEPGPEPGPYNMQNF